MKNLSLIFAVILVGLIIVGTIFNLNNKEKVEEKGADMYFIGTIEEINEQNALVQIKEGDILSSGDKVTINLSIERDKDFKIGDKVKVEYDGMVRESYPLGINTISIELVK